MQKNCRSWFLAGHLSLAAFYFFTPLAAAEETDNSQLRSLLKREARPQISADTFYDKIYGAWLGQLVGNIYGLPHENLYIEEPGPDAFPYGYDFKEIPFYPQYFGSGSMTGVMRAMGGAFSDDDTDFEYVYLSVMENQGIEPTYAQIRDAWTYHVRDWVWIANRSALGLMLYGLSPPATGAKESNVHWYQIDPQLINEIWAVTAPGMIDYAAAKSAWGARISNDGWGIEPTIHYGAMYAAAFFESDVRRLIDIGTASLPEGSRFARTVQDMKDLHAAYPNDWRKARREMADKYYDGAEYKTIWNANLNGAAAILALLYGDGDVQKTLDLACAIGFDADNQAASMMGLLGVAYGRSGLPDDLLMPIAGWSEPLNDRYINRSRFDLPNDSIKNIATRTLAVAEKVIVKNGGRKLEEDGKIYYRVNAAAPFTPPLELAAEPVRQLNIGNEVLWTYYAGGKAPKWKKLAGEFPPGLDFRDGVLSGSPTTAGSYLVELQVREAGQKIKQRFEYHVRGKNLALMAQLVAAPPSRNGRDVESLRDGRAMGELSYESAATKNAKVESFGYDWTVPQKLAVIEVALGDMGEVGGWFTSLSADYLSEAGTWLPVPGLSISPEPLFDNSPFYHPPYAVYTLTFDPIVTTSIRVRGLSGGVEGNRYVSISEVGVYGPLSSE